MALHLNSSAFSANAWTRAESWNLSWSQSCFHAPCRTHSTSKNEDGRHIRHYRFRIILAFMRIGFAKTWILYYYYSGKCGLISKNYHKYERQCVLLPLPCAEQKLFWRQSDNLHVYRVHIISAWDGSAKRSRANLDTQRQHACLTKPTEKHTHTRRTRASAFRYLHKAPSFAQATGWTTSETAASLLNPTGCLRIQA